jgi:hypothetical protein
MFSKIKVGTRVTILVPNGKRWDRETNRIVTEYKEASGRAVMLGPGGWVLNMGGRFGTPGIATPENFVRLGR